MSTLIIIEVGFYKSNLTILCSFKYFLLLCWICFIWFKKDASYYCWKSIQIQHIFDFWDSWFTRSI